MSVLVDSDREFSSAEVCRLTGATYRQVDYWARLGHLGDHAQNVGTGFSTRRRFTAHDLEVAFVVRTLHALGCNGHNDHGVKAAALAKAIDVVRERPVVTGEWLIVTFGPPRARRMISASLAGEAGALWAVPLRTAEELAS